MKIYIIRDNISSQMWAYTSITAAVIDLENPLDLTTRRWHQIVREKGYPFQHSGCTIHQLWCMTTSQVREENPAIITDEI